MKPPARLDGRMHAPEAIASSHAEGAAIVIGCPLVGEWRPALAPGQLVVGGAVLGDVEVLGQPVRVIAPAGARGVVTSSVGAQRGRVAVGYGTTLYALDPDVGGVAMVAAEAAHAETATGLVFVAPTSGRLYRRSGPGKAAFVSVGDVLAEGQTVCLLEVMKTFNRVVYTPGGGLPARAKVLELVAADESDVAAGDVLMRLEPA
jgi:acetyl-CoA carboxylase biotin carboxyl carrier protein